MKKDRTREKILSAAREVFSSKGYTKAATKEIAKVAGIAEITIYRKFETKSNLFHETVINYLIAPILDCNEKNSNKNSKETILKIVKERISTLKNNKDLFMSVIAEAQFNDEVKAILKEIYYKVFDVLVLSLEPEQKKFNGVETEHMAQILLSTIVGVIIIESLNVDKEFGNSDRMLETIKTLIYNSN